MKNREFATGLVAMLVLAAAAVAIASGLRPADAAVGGMSGDTSSIVIVGTDEPGEPLIVTGVVYRDGRPAPGIMVKVYQTDKDGLYERKDKPSDGPRIKGTMLTDSAGRYEFRTIKPGHYPDGGNPPHIHYVITGPGLKEQYASLHFEGEKFTDKISAEEREDEFQTVRPVTKVDGVLRVTKNINIK